LIDPDVMVIIITGFGTLQSAVEAIRQAAFDFIAKPFNVNEVLGIVERAVQRRRFQIKAKSLLKQSCGINRPSTAPNSNDPSFRDRQDLSPFPANDLDGSNHQTCLEFSKVLSFTLEEKDPYTSGHSERVCYYSDLISRRISLPPTDRNELQIASYLHDIGKIGISNHFINKKGALKATDWAVIKQHTRKALDLLAPLNLSPSILSYIEHHHERFDGSGYPEGLKGNQIPLGARIIAVSDSYDSMTSNRPYRKPFSQEEARKELLKWAGKQFDPKLVSAFLFSLEERRESVEERSPLKRSSLSH
jgi:HD-GYP domain-containing protein (c-di-GMP phosphodiesterase class II)